MKKITKNKNTQKGFLKSLLLPALILSIIIFTIFFWTKNSESTKETENTKTEKNSIKKPSGKFQEKFIEISKLSLAPAPIKIYGKTAAKSEVNVYAEIPAKITKIYASLGDYVNAGDVIVTLGDQNERSNLAAAKLSVNSAELALEKTLSGARHEDKEIAKLDVKIKSDALEKTNSDIKKQVADLKIFLESTLRIDIDDYFDHTEPDSRPETDPVFTHRLSSEVATAKLEEMRKSLGKNFKKFLENEPDYSDSERISKSVKITEQFSELAELLYKNSKDFLGFSDSENEISEAKTLAIKNKIDAQRDIITNLKNISDTQSSSLKIAENALSKTNAGARQEDINLSKASVESAQNSVSAAEIALAKKTLRAPISGKISEISADIGQLANSTTPIFSIANPTNIKVESEISTQNLKNIFIGKEILANGETAKISAISPIANSSTGTISFEAEFKKSQKFLAGEIISIEIPTSNSKTDTENSKKNKLEKSKNIVLPLSSVFEENEKYFIFLLGSDLKAKRTNVEFIKISGDNIVVKNIFTGTEKLIINARGISNGDEL